MDLVGRRAERESLEHLLDEARAGRSGALTVLGEAGIGKTAVLEHARAVADRTGFRIEIAIGVEAETQFAYGALHQLCVPLLERLDALPEPQRIALGVAFGQREGTAPDRFLVGLAVLNLLAEIAEERPLLCIVDDAQWLDEASGQVLGFVARRVAAERLALLFAVRESGQERAHPLARLPHLRLSGLADTDARDLLTSTIHAPLDAGVRDRIVAEARGNPLALLELPRGAAAGRLAGGFGLPVALSVPHRIEEAFRRRAGDLPSDTQLLLLVAAAEPTGDAAVLWHAADSLGLGRDAVAAAEAAGLVEIDTRVRFRHPLVRSTIYQAAAAPDRRRAHRALAAATDGRADPDRRAWHSARAVSGTNEEVAAQLLGSAGRAQARGGWAASAAFLQQAAELTPDPATRATRALEAAHAHHEAGAFEAARELLELAATGPLDAMQHARLQRLQAWSTFHLTRGDDVPEMLLQAAKTLTPLDAGLSRETYLLALDTATIVGGLERVRSVLAATDVTELRPQPSTAPGLADLLLDGLVTSYLHGYEAGAPALRRAVTSLRDDPTAEDEDERWLWLASRVALSLYDDELVQSLGSHHVSRARAAGALLRLPGALVFRAYGLVLAGQLGQAVELATEADSLAEATGATPWRWVWPVLAAWHGRRDEAVELSTPVVEEATEYGELHMAHYALAVLYNGLGDYPLASDAAMRACDGGELVITSIALPELVEAAVRAGHDERAAAAVDQLGSWARASGTPWAVGLAARARALLSDGDAADLLYREAIGSLGGCGMAVYLARTHLVYGEWLRRAGRRQEAREQLRAAHTQLADMGAEAFAARAARELRATGEHPRGRTSQPIDALTPHELQIARLVATGATSREVAAQLFLSPRTIEAHLRNIFRKLDITSRRQLRDLRLG